MQEDDSSQQREKMKSRLDKALSPIRLLFLTSNPPHQYQAQEQLRIEQEMRGITSAISNGFDLRKEEAVRIQDLSRHLLRHQPLLLHFSGHGTEEGELLLEKYDSLDGTNLSTGLAVDADYIEYSVIAKILAEYQATLRCVVLNASCTEPLAEAICAEIPCAIGMRGPVNDFLAIRFAEIFYRSLTMGESVGLAFRKARSDVLSHPNAREETFHLKSKVGVNPDDIFFIPPSRGRAGMADMQENSVDNLPRGQINNTKRVKILYCYARKDKLLRDELEKHLLVLERSEQVITWYDRKILPGTEWKNEINDQLDTSDIILLLISSNFIQSDYCYSVEMQRALERHREGTVHVIPIILRPCDWKAMPIHALQALPENGKPISKWRNRDDAFQDVVKGIRQVIDALYSTLSYREESDEEAKYNEMILCPYCLTIQELTIQELQQIATRCSNPKCGQELPHRYREKARTGNVTCLGTFGLSSHGKSAFLSSLMQAALAVYKIVPGGYFHAFDGDTQKKLNEWSERYKDGRVKMPTTSPVELPRPLLVMNNNFPLGHPNILVAYDLAGEVLELAGTQPEYARALSKVNTVWYIVSLDDLINHNDAGYSMDSLFNIYQHAMAELRVPIKGKNILVVYTKADLLVGVGAGLEPLPDEVVEYLATDPYDQLRMKRASELPAFDKDAYFAKMTRISDILLEYTVDFVDGGGAFMSMVRDTGAQVYFTVNSAYGSPLGSNDTLGPLVHSVRVLDALIWAIKLNSGK